MTRLSAYLTSVGNSVVGASGGGGRPEGSEYLPLYKYRAVFYMPIALIVYLGRQ